MKAISLPESWPPFLPDPKQPALSLSKGLARRELDPSASLRTGARGPKEHEKTHRRRREEEVKTAADAVD